MNPNVVLPFLSSLLSFIFAILVADQWLRRRQPYQLVWTIGLLWYGISAGTEFLGGAYGWNEPLYRAWYLIGAFGVAAYLGLGTVWLLRNTRFGYFVAVQRLRRRPVQHPGRGWHAPRRATPASAATVAGGRGLLHGGGDRAGGGHALRGAEAVAPTGGASSW